MHSVTVAYIFRFRTFRCVPNTDLVVFNQVSFGDTLIRLHSVCNINSFEQYFVVEHPEQQHT